MADILVADLFCGAGGSSTGAKRALGGLGLAMDLVAVNHWDTAIATHSRNHPEARHYLRDLAAADPIMLVPEGKLDLLMASPTCTHHSRARGGRPSSDQQRMDPWAIVRWCSELRVKRLLVENVPEYVEWGPIDLRTGRPLKSRRGEHFRAWVAALQGLGFRTDWRLLNAADFGDATTRVRFFLIARSDGRALRWPTPTHSRTGGGLFGEKKWRAAREIIDWSIPGQSIYARKRPLAAATLARIHAGAVRLNWPEPYLVVLRRHMAGQSLDAPLPALTAGGTHVGLAEPFLLNRHGENGATARAHPLDGPMPTADCRGAGYLVEPFTLGTGSGGAPRPVKEPLPTITTGGAGNADRPGCARPMLVAPFIANLAHAGSDASRCLDVGAPLQTLHAGGGSHALVEPFILNQDQRGAPRPAGDPLPTIAAAGAHALIGPYYGSGSGETCRSAAEPLPTATAKARFGLVVPITHSGGGNRARPVEDPLPTITTSHRGELAVIVAAHGERAGQAPRTHSVEQPCPTICAKGRVQLAEPDPVTYDIRFRMLQPHELAAAMGFVGDDLAYEFAGTKTEITKQIGNAVPVNLARALVAALFAEHRLERRDG